MTSDNDRTCALCGGPATAHGTYFGVEFENVGPEVWKDFCSWEHLTEWVNRGEPDWAAEAVDYPHGGRLAGLGCLVFLLIVLGLMVVGAVTMVRLVF